MIGTLPSLAREEEKFPREFCAWRRGEKLLCEYFCSIHGNVSAE